MPPPTAPSAALQAFCSEIAVPLQLCHSPEEPTAGRDTRAETGWHSPSRLAWAYCRTVLRAALVPAYVTRQYRMQLTSESVPFGSEPGCRSKFPTGFPAPSASLLTPPSTLVGRQITSHPSLPTAANMKPKIGDSVAILERARPWEGNFST